MDNLYDELRRIYKRQSFVIKNSYKKAGFFEFLFKHLFKIIKWNKRFNLLNIAPFSTQKVRVKYSFKDKLCNLYLTYLFPLAKYVKVILEKGWKWSFLSIKEYNCIALFYELIKRFEYIDNAKTLNESDFLKMEDAFLRLSSNKHYVDIITDTFKKYFEIIEKRTLHNMDKDKDNIVSKILLNIEFFFSTKYVTPSIYDFITTYNFTIFNKYITFEQLIINKPFDIIQNDFFECGKEIFDQIINYTKNLVKENKRLEKEKENIVWLMNIINNERKPDKMEKHYIMIKRNWDKDAIDAFLFFIRFMDGLTEKLTFILYKEWELIDNNETLLKTKIFDKNQIDLNMIKLNSEFFNLKSKYYSMVSPKISLAEFQNSENPIKLFNEHQVSLFEKIIIITGLLRDIGLTMKNNIQNDKLTIKNADRNKYMVLIPEEWKANSVYDVFIFYMELLIQTAAFFKDSNLLYEVKRIGSIEDKLDENRSKLQRVLDSNQHLLKFIDE